MLLRGVIYQGYIVLAILLNNVISTLLKFNGKHKGGGGIVPPTSANPAKIPYSKTSQIKKAKIE